MSVAIRIENVSKLYRLGNVGTGTISHDINRWWHQIRGKEDPYTKIGQVNDRTKKASKLAVESSQSSESPTAEQAHVRSKTEYVWALKDINLEVQQGEILGIIGRNGAGKSTLLKLLSRVTAPTTGSIKTKGRIASLLEVGTGFHPELTGRENVYMNGAILGMRRHEISKRLYDISEFSGCGKYLDTPTKRYSSGMTVRLGFSVAAHLACETLIVDEVLAVGDVEFQKQCIGKMKDVAGEGRTVLFVSHNMASVESLCTSAAIIEHGQVYQNRLSPTEAIERYYNLTASPVFNGHARNVDDVKVRVVASENGSNTCLLGKSVRFEVEMTLNQQVSSPRLGIGIDSPNGERHLTLHTPKSKETGILSGGVRRWCCTVDSLPLRPGTYFIKVSLTSHGRLVREEERISELHVIDADLYGEGRGFHKGLCVAPATWQVPAEAIE